LLVTRTDAHFAGDFQAFILANDGAKVFCVGANLAELLARIEDRNFTWIEEFIRRFQSMCSSIRFSPKPVVAAPFGLALGGGAEIVLHSAFVQAHAELHVGLVEPNVGLILAGGGCRMSLLNALAGNQQQEWNYQCGERLRRSFEQIVKCYATSSAFEAKAAGLLPCGAQITMNRRRLTWDAKAQALARKAQAFMPPTEENQVSEGCISCHSQYVGPGTADQLMWGPLLTMKQIHAQKPPLIGNRRQGPDLAEVGTRRSALWLKAHLIAPAALSSRSPMPSYAFLFEDGRGDDLVSYLASLGSHDPSQLQLRAAWHPSAATWSEASINEGAELYAHHCFTCHDAHGTARLLWGTQFRHMPPNLANLWRIAQNSSPSHIAQVVRFGEPGTDMPGHEFLSDHEITSLVLWLTQSTAQPVPRS
jgi:enoyl-CoA hydratase/carnithine racemase/mono/diheme cytochrome c family protein